ncbi:MAG TPA: TIGR03364 family FAD-dependent oxidoreductase, partial [Pirellulales bacterium]
MSLDVAVVGAGILGLAHAWSAAKRGYRVTVFERTRHATGASIRNFGMIWPIGQPAGQWHAVALASRQRWLELGAADAIELNACGSIHLAHRRDEWDVLEEFQDRSAELGYECSLLTAAEVLARSPASKRDGLLGGLFSASELCVNPRLVVRSLPRWLTARFGVRFHFETAVQHVDPATGDRWQVTAASEPRGPFDRVIVCGGTDCRLLFPQAFAGAELPLCKLQMLRTSAQPGGWRLGPHLAGGLTLRHYRNFEICRSLAALKQRVAAETPELDRYGIHVMASQNAAGEVILGDSHEYDADFEPFDKPLIDELVLRELQKIMHLPDWTIAQRWHGFYVKNPAAPIFESEPLAGVHVCTGLGGSGMTMSFGLAE